MIQMVVRKAGRRKWRRGQRTYHGSHKKWRGGGSRGGRGGAGLHKHKWSYIVKYDPEHFGKEGFRRPSAVIKKWKTINLSDLDGRLDRLVEQKMVDKEKDAIKVNLAKIGFDKLLGTGRITRPIIVEAKSFSKSAIEKLEASGGKAVKV